jgi:DNA-binding NtrC family response regulator
MAQAGPSSHVRALIRRRPSRRQRRSPEPRDTLSGFESILGESAAAERIREFGRRAADVDATVLLTGESGTGKGLLARLIHANSARRRSALVSVNSASVPDTLFESEFFGHTRGAFTGAQQAHRGLLEQADRGTLFMDEVGELSLPLQAKLLTAIEDGEFRRVGGESLVRVDVRIVAATGVDLDRAVEERAFRRDLYHRLMVLSFRLPPLRDRDGDIDLFAGRFLESFAQRYSRPIRGFEAATLALIRACPWPGNVRQLANAIESAVLTCDAPRIGLRHLPSALLTTDRMPEDGMRHAPAGPAVPEQTKHQESGSRARYAPRTRYSHFGTAAEERRRIEEVLQRCHGNKTLAARELGMARNTLREKLRRLRALPDAAR